MNVDLTKDFVKKYITCLRKSGLPAYPHSWGVGDKLQKYCFSEDIVTAGILHDVIEDSVVTFEDLRYAGYSDYVVYLVDMVSHDETIVDRDIKWTSMMLRCIDQQSSDVWAIKIADFRDNIQDFVGVSPEFIEMMLLKRGPMFVYYGNRFFQGTSFYNDFIDEYRDQVKKYHNYVIIAAIRVTLFHPNAYNK